MCMKLYFLLSIFYEPDYLHTDLPSNLKIHTVNIHQKN